MKLLDEDALGEVEDDTAPSNGSGEEDKGILKSLERKAEEIENEADNPK